MNSLSEHYTTVLNQYSQWLNTLGYAARTVACYTTAVRDFLLWLSNKNIVCIALFNANHLHQYIGHLEQTISPHTGKALSLSQRNNCCIALDKFCTCLHQLGRDNAPSPTNYRLYTKTTPEFEVLSLEQIKALYNSIEHTFSEFTFAKRLARQAVLRLVLDLCYGCGLRKSELFYLKLKDVRLEQKTLHIGQPKNYRDRYVPMSKTIVKNTQEFIYNYRRDFPQREGMLYPYAIGNINVGLNYLVQHTQDAALKNKRVFPHLLRHSIATHLLDQGMGIEHISRFLGHASLEATQIYTHISGESPQIKMARRHSHKR